MDVFLLDVWTSMDRRSTYGRMSIGRIDVNAQEEHVLEVTIFVTIQITGQIRLKLSFIMEEVRMAMAFGHNLASDSLDRA